MDTINIFLTILQDKILLKINIKGEKKLFFNKNYDLVSLKTAIHLKNKLLRMISSKKNTIFFKVLHLNSFFVIN